MFHGAGNGHEFEPLVGRGLSFTVGLALAFVIFAAIVWLP